MLKLVYLGLFCFGGSSSESDSFANVIARCGGKVLPRPLRFSIRNLRGVLRERMLEIALDMPRQAKHSVHERLHLAAQC